MTGVIRPQVSDCSQHPQISGGTRCRMPRDASTTTQTPMSWSQPTGWPTMPTPEHALCSSRSIFPRLEKWPNTRCAENSGHGHWAEVDIEKNLMFVKGWEALGAFNSTERIRALDLLG